jgi:hypothetical protein
MITMHNLHLEEYECDKSVVYLCAHQASILFFLLVFSVCEEIMLLTIFRCFPCYSMSEEHLMGHSVPVCLFRCLSLFSCRVGNQHD